MVRSLADRTFQLRPDPVQLPGQGTIFVSTFGRRTKEYLKYMFGEGGIYEQLQELKMPAEEVLTKALTFLDPLVPGKETTVPVHSRLRPAVKATGLVCSVGIASTYTSSMRRMYFLNEI